MAAVRQFVRKYKTYSVAEWINTAVVHRLENRGQGISTKKEIIIGNLNAAKELKEVPIVLKPKRLLSIGMRVSVFGILEAGRVVAAIEMAGSKEEQAIKGGLAS